MLTKSSSSRGKHEQYSREGRFESAFWISVSKRWFCLRKISMNAAFNRLKDKIHATFIICCCMYVYITGKNANKFKYVSACYIFYDSMLIWASSSHFHEYSWINWSTKYWQSLWHGRLQCPSLHCIAFKEGAPLHWILSETSLERRAFNAM